MTDKEIIKRQSEWIAALIAENGKLRHENKALRGKVADYEAVEMVAKKRVKNALKLN